MRVFHEEGVTARGQVLQMEMTGRDDSTWPEAQ